jgi:hypothetical protein
MTEPEYGYTWKPHRSCDVVAPGCTAPPGLGRLVAPARHTCYRCGNPVCGNCSRRVVYMTYGRRRICLNCLDELHREKRAMKIPAREDYLKRIISLKRMSRLLRDGSVEQQRGFHADGQHPGTYETCDRIVCVEHRRMIALANATIDASNALVDIP